MRRKMPAKSLTQLLDEVIAYENETHAIGARADALYETTRDGVTVPPILYFQRSDGEMAVMVLGTIEEQYASDQRLGDLEAAARLRSTRIEAFKDYKARLDAALDAAGVTALNKETDHRAAVATKMWDKLIYGEARTQDDLIAKLRGLAWCHGWDTKIETGVTSDMLERSITADLARLYPSDRPDLKAAS